MSDRRARWMARSAPARSECSEIFVRLRSIVLLGFVLRLGWVLYAMRRPPAGSGDAAFYLETARRLADGDGYSLIDGEPTALWPPGYSLILSGPVFVFERLPVPGDVMVAAAVLNIVAGTATVLLAGVLGWRLSGWRVGRITAAIVACFPSLVMYTGTVLSETVFTFLVVAALVVLAWDPWRRVGVDVVLPSTARFAVAGVIAGVACLVRPTLLSSLVLVPIAVWLVARDADRTLRRSLALLAATAAVIVPWTVRNNVAMDAFVPVSTNTGINLCIGNHPDAQGAFVLSPYCFDGLPTEQTTEAELERDRLLTERALDWAREHPLEQLRLVPLRSLRLVVNDNAAVPAVMSFGADPWMTTNELIFWNWLGDAYFFGVVALAVLGALVWRPAGDRRKLLLLLVLLGALLSVWAFFGDTRFKVPMNPLLAVFAAHAISLGLSSTSTGGMSAASTESVTPSGVGGATARHSGSSAP